MPGLRRVSDSMTHTSRRLSDSQHTHLNPQHSANALEPTARRVHRHTLVLKQTCCKRNTFLVRIVHCSCTRNMRTGEEISLLVYLEDSMALLQQGQKRSVLLYRERVESLLWSVDTHACLNKSARHMHICRYMPHAFMDVCVQ